MIDGFRADKAEHSAAIGGMYRLTELQTRDPGS